MRKGCIVFTVLLAVVIGVAGIWAYSYFTENFDIPEELEAYADFEDALARIESKAPAPGPDARIDEKKLDALLAAFDSVKVGWGLVDAALDSLMNADSSFDSVDVNFWATPWVVKQMIMAPLITRRGMVASLNAHNLSWAEYLWLKERVAAAAAITSAEVDSMVTRDINLPDRNFSVGDDDSEARDQFFARVDSLRTSGSIDSSEIAIAMRRRNAIIDRGFPALMGFDHQDEGAVDATLGVTPDR